MKGNKKKTKELKETMNEKYIMKRWKRRKQRKTMRREKRRKGNEANTGKKET